jgi:hypothetical protein
MQVADGGDLVRGSVRDWGERADRIGDGETWGLGDQRGRSLGDERRTKLDFRGF